MDQHPNSILSDYIHEPFLMMLAGCVLYFLALWKMGWYDKKVGFYKDQKDDMIFALVAGMMFVIWDSQVLKALDFCFKYLGIRDEDAGDLIMHTYYYFLVSPAAEILIEGVKLLGRLKPKFNGK